MKSWFGLPLVLLALTALAHAEAEGDLSSPFASTVPGLTLPNAHLVGRHRGEVLRGMSPLTNNADHLAEMVGYGVTDVVIFKDELAGDVTREINRWVNDYGFPRHRIHAIPFRWKGVPDFRTACEQTVDALQVLEKAYETKGRRAYFHCTVGEDRTGLLAGVFRLLEQKREGWTVRRAFEEEMCRHGYEAGNPGKPDFVVRTIRDELTPVYLKLAALIARGDLRPGHLDRDACAHAVAPIAPPSAFVCGASPLYEAPGQL